MIKNCKKCNKQIEVKTCHTLYCGECAIILKKERNLVAQKRYQTKEIVFDFKEIKKIEDDLQKLSNERQDIITEAKKLLNYSKPIYLKSENVVRKKEELTSIYADRGSW
jgi:hypothetical protein